MPNELVSYVLILFLDNNLAAGYQLLNHAEYPNLLDMASHMSFLYHESSQTNYGLSNVRHCLTSHNARLLLLATIR